MAEDAKKTSKFGKIIPWEDIIICTEPPEDTTDEGILLSNNTDDSKKPEKGIVWAIGPLSDPKKKLPFDIKVGDLLFYERYTANRVPDNGVEYNFVRLKFVMGVKKAKEEK